MPRGSVIPGGPGSTGGGTPAPGVAAGRPLVDASGRPKRDSLVSSAALLVVAVTGAAQSLLLVLIAGGGTTADAVIAAYSLFLVVALLAGATRSSLVPLFGATTPEEAFRARAAETASRTALVGVVAAVVTAVVTPAIVVLLSGTLDADARVTFAASMAILAPAGYLQVRSAGCSAVLAATNRFRTSAVIYAACATGACAAAAPLLETIGALGLPVAALLGAVALAAAHHRVLAGFGIRVAERPAMLAEREQWRLTRVLLLMAAVPLAWQLQLLLALAAVSPRPGEVTAYTYAYFLVNAALTVTVASGSLVTLPTLVAGLARDGARAATDYLDRVVPVGIVSVGLLMAAGVAFGEPVLDALLADSLGAGRVATLHDVLTIFTVLAAANAVVLFLWPSSVGLGREPRLAAAAAASVAVMGAAAAAAQGDTLEVAAAQAAVAVLVLAVGWIAVLGGAAAAGGVRLLADVVPAVLPLGVFAVVRLVAGDGGTAAGAIGISVGCGAAACVLGAAVWPRAWGLLPGLGAIARRSPMARTA